MLCKLNISEDSFKEKARRSWGEGGGQNQNIGEIAQHNAVMENKILHEVKKRGHTCIAFGGFHSLSFQFTLGILVL